MVKPLLEICIGISLPPLSYAFSSDILAGCSVITWRCNGHNLVRWGKRRAQFASDKIVWTMDRNVAIELLFTWPFKIYYQPTNHPPSLFYVPTDPVPGLKIFPTSPIYGQANLRKVKLIQGHMAVNSLQCSIFTILPAQTLRQITIQWSWAGCLRDLNAWKYRVRIPCLANQLAVAARVNSCPRAISVAN